MCILPNGIWSTNTLCEVLNQAMCLSKQGSTFSIENFGSASDRMKAMNAAMYVLKETKPTLK